MRNTGYIFRRQHSIDRYIADFYCPRVKLAIEVDGLIHDTKDQIEHDKIRDEIIAIEGVTILRFKNSEILEDPSQALIQIRDTLDRLCKQPSP